MITNKRILAFIIDTAVFMIIFMTVNIIPIYDDYFSDADVMLDAKYYIIYGISLLLIAILYISKDCVKGQSLGKRLMKIKAVSISGERTHVWQLLVRNITVFIWPAEFILLLCNKRRIGDVIAKTKVVEI